MSLQNILDGFVKKFKQLQFSTKKQQAFLEDIAVLIDDGVPASKAINMLSKIHESGIEKEVSLHIAKKISEGKTLAAGLREWFNANTVELIRAGEEGGALAQTIHSAANALSKRNGSMGAIIGALVYPLMVIIMGCYVIVYLNGSVFNDFKSIHPIDQWPAAGQELVVLANIIQYWWWASIILLFLALYGIKEMLFRYVGDYRGVVDGIPMLSLYKKLTAARIMETLGLLVSNGIVFKSALKVMQYNASPYVSSHLLMMEHLMSHGKDNIAEVLDTGLIDKKDILRLKVIAEAKGFDHALIRMGRHASDEGANTIKLLAKILGGILLAVGAGLIAFLIRGLYMTGMSLGS